MIELNIIPMMRNDSKGAGHYGAPRGDRTHNGIDFAVLPGSILKSTVTGTVTKLGYCYNDDLQWRYVQITCDKNFKHRFFYVESSVKVGDLIKVGTYLGTVQDISERYEGMTPHIHYEVMNKYDHFMNPELIWN